MPARKSTPFLDERWRQKIQASMLINRLTDHAAGRNEMTATQVRAAEILLKKILPDLAAVECSGETTVKYVPFILAALECCQHHGLEGVWQRGSISVDRCQAALICRSKSIV